MKEVEIYAAQVGKSYNFLVDENVPLSVLAEEVASIIAQKEQSDMTVLSQNTVFYDTGKGSVFDMTRTAAELGIKSGARLCIV